MALVKFGQGIAGLAGKQGGTVFAHNRYGSYSRNWKKPTNPRTGRQTAARARLTSSSQGWRDLTDAQRTAWNEYAAATPLSNKIGEPIFLSGQAMYTRTNAFALQDPAATQIFAAPTTPGQAQMIALADQVSLSAALKHLVLAGTSTNWESLGFSAEAGSRLQIQISPPLSEGVTFHAGPWLPALPVTAGYIEGLANPDDPIILSAATLSTGQHRIIRVRQQLSDGKLSPVAQSGVLVVAA